MLTQYKSHSLNRHITTAWRLNSLQGGYVTPVPAQQRLGPYWHADESDPRYWRDLSALDVYFDAHMDLCAVHPLFNLYNDRWPILTGVPLSLRRSSFTTRATGWDMRSTAW